MTIKKILNQEKGMSLVQVMIGVALSGVVSMLLVELFSAMTKIQSRAKIDGEVVQLIEDVRTAFTRTEACKETLGSVVLPNYTAAPLSLISVKDAGGKVMLEKNIEPFAVVASPLKVSDLTIRLSDKTPNLLPESLLVADLVITLETKNHAIMVGTQVWQRKITLTVETDSSNAIVSCNTLSVADRTKFEDVTCKTMGGKVNASNICDLTPNKAIVKAACQAIGFNDNGEHCVH